MAEREGERQKTLATRLDAPLEVKAPSELRRCCLFVVAKEHARTAATIKKVGWGRIFLGDRLRVTRLPASTQFQSAFSAPTHVLRPRQHQIVVWLIRTGSPAPRSQGCRPLSLPRSLPHIQRLVIYQRHPRAEQPRGAAGPAVVPHAGNLPQRRDRDPAGVLG